MAFLISVLNHGDKYLIVSGGEEDIFIKPGDSAQPLFEDGAAVGVVQESPEDTAARLETYVVAEEERRAAWEADRAKVGNYSRDEPEPEREHHRTLHVHKSKKEREREAKEARAREAAAVGDAGDRRVMSVFQGRAPRRNGV